jgi:hypothetical protein
MSSPSVTHRELRQARDLLGRALEAYEVARGLEQSRERDDVLASASGYITQAVTLLLRSGSSVGNELIVMTAEGPH